MCLVSSLIGGVECGRHAAGPSSKPPRRSASRTDCRVSIRPLMSDTRSRMSARSRAASLRSAWMARWPPTTTEITATVVASTASSSVFMVCDGVQSRFAIHHVTARRTTYTSTSSTTTASPTAGSLRSIRRPGLSSPRTVRSAVRMNPVGHEGPKAAPPTTSSSPSRRPSSPRVGALVIDYERRRVTVAGRAVALAGSRSPPLRWSSTPHRFAPSLPMVPNCRPRNRLTCPLPREDCSLGDRNDSHRGARRDSHEQATHLR